MIDKGKHYFIYEVKTFDENPLYQNVIDYSGLLAILWASCKSLHQGNFLVSIKKFKEHLWPPQKNDDKE